MSKTNYEKNKEKCARYQARKKVRQLQQEVEEQEAKLKRVRESSSPEVTESLELKLAYTKKLAELYSMYKLENTLTSEQYKQKKAELKNSIFSTELKQKRALARKKYYYKKRYGSEWQEAIEAVPERNLNIPFKANTNEYKREWLRLKKERVEQEKAKNFKAFGRVKEDKDFIAERIAKKRKFYDNHKSVHQVGDMLPRYSKFMETNGYRDWFDVPSELKAPFPLWDRIDIAERFAVHIIPVYAKVIKKFRLTTIPPYNIFDFIPPYMGVTNEETAFEKMGEQGFTEFKFFLESHLQKEVDKNITVEEPAEK